MPRRRGRPRQANAKRRCTTRAGRRTGLDPRDDGAPLLRLRKQHLTGRTDIEMTPAGILYGRGHLDRHQYDALDFVGHLLRQVRAAMGGNLSLNGLWAAIVGAAARRSGGPAIIGDHNARRALAGILGRLDGSRALVVELVEGRSAPPLVQRAAEHRLFATDRAALEALRRGLDTIAAPAWWGRDEPG